MQRVLEIVTFQTNPSVAEVDFLAAAEAASAVLSRMSGFRDRRLLRAGDGWMDIVEWDDPASAAKAAETFHLIPEAVPFCGMIDMASATMAHYPVALSS